MGVSCILLWEPPEGLNPGQALEWLQKKVETYGSRSLGGWSVDCESLQSTAALVSGGPQKVIYMVHSTQYPRTTFSVLDSWNCLVADNTLDSIFSQLKTFYAPRKGLKIEAKGYQFEHANYLIKFGAVTIGSASKGIVVEVEDKDNDIIPQCWGNLSSFIKGLLDYSHNIDPPAFVRPSDRPYLPSDAMINYAYVFTQLRKPASFSTAAK